MNRGDLFGIHPGFTVAALGTIREALSTRSFHVVTESELQRAVEAVLHAEGLVFEREARLGPHDRIDFLTSAGIGIELKIEGATSSIARQLQRYAQHGAVRGLLLVTTRAVHAGVFERLPEINGKPLQVARLRGSLL